MNDVTRILDRLEDDDPQAVEDLFVIAYGELRNMAALHLQAEKPGQTLQATAIVHEAWLKMMTPADDAAGHASIAATACNPAGPQWKCRSHFFGAAAEAMRRILVDHARRRKRLKRGGDRQRNTLDLEAVAGAQPEDILESLDEALQKFQTVDPVACELVKLRYFAGLSQFNASTVLNIAPRTADRLWAFAKAWLLREIQ